MQPAASVKLCVFGDIQNLCQDPSEEQLTLNRPTSALSLCLLTEAIQTKYIDYLRVEIHT